MKTSAAAAQRRKLLVARRNRATLESARAAGLLGGAKSTRVAGRVSAELIAAAKRSAGVSSDTEVIEVALARLALEDDFGAKLARNKGTISRELDIEF
jgi:Arc/MetJ family transcription regulator